MDERNAYEVLGIEPGAPEAEIKAAYRARSLLYHPDRLADAPPSARQVALVEMKALNKAYGVLKDPDRRAALDRQLARSAGEPESQPSDLEHTRPNIANQQTRPARAVSSARVRVNVTVGRATGQSYQPSPPFPPSSSTVPPPSQTRPQAKPAPSHPSRRRYNDLRADLWRFLLFGAFSSLGWVVVMVTGLLAPPMVWLVGLGFGVGLVAALRYIKPGRRRRSFDMMWWAGRGLLLVLVLIAVVFVAVFPEIALSLTGAGAVGSASGTVQAVPWLVAVIFVLAAHWGICLLSYLFG